MATIKEVLKVRLKSLNFLVSEAELDVYLIEAGVDGELVFTASALTDFKRVLHSVIPQLLLMPNVSEGGFSVQRDVEAIKTYYATLCKDLGLPNAFDITVNDRSSIW